MLVHTNIVVYMLVDGSLLHLIRRCCCGVAGGAGMAALCWGGVGRGAGMTVLCWGVVGNNTCVGK